MSRSLLAALPLLGAAALAAPASSQAFVPGDVYVHALTTGNAGVLARVDRASGTTTTVLAIGVVPPITPGSVTWDPARKSLVLMHSSDSAVAASMKLCKADGTLEDLTGPIGLRYSLTPGKNGRIYCWGLGQIQYVEPDGSLHTLQDATGQAPFVHDPVFTLSNDVMAYHQASNSLYTAMLRGSAHPCNGGTPGIIVSRLPLAPDGTSVEGPVTCTVLTMPPEGLGGFPVAWVRLPSGKPGLVTSGSLHTSVASRVFELDPETLAFTSYVSSGGYTGYASASAATWSGAEKKVTVLDPVSDVLRSFAKGIAGAGSVRPVALDFALNYCAMVEVPQRQISVELGAAGLLAGPLAALGEEATLTGSQEGSSGEVSVRLVGAPPHAVVHLRVVAGARGTTRSAILDTGETLTARVGDGELWPLLAPRLAALGGTGELRIQALVSDGGRGSRARLSNELVLAAE